MTTSSSKTAQTRHRKYGSSTNAIDVLEEVDLTGKTILVTGTTHGIGTETARVLALKGATVVMANRNVAQSEEIRKNIYAEYTDSNKRDNIHIIQLDLSSLQSVRKAAREFISRDWPLHALVQNAGLFAPPTKTTVDGHESSFGINHLGHFYLTHLLLEKLRETPKSRIVLVSSNLHQYTGIKASASTDEKLGKLIPDPSGNDGSVSLYNCSKLCNALTGMKLHREELKNGIHTYYLHPGVIGTNLTQEYGFLGKVFRCLAHPFLKSIEQGAATTVYCAASPDVADASGKYYESCWDDEKGLQKNLVHDEALQDALWDRSMEFIKKFEELNP